MGPSGSGWAPARTAIAAHDSSTSSNRRAWAGISTLTSPKDQPNGEHTIIIIGMEPTPGNTPIFSLEQARALLPQVKHLTADAVRRAEALASQLHGLAEDDPQHVSLSAVLREVVDGWADEVRALGLEAKGLWLVDFDNGQGYYCWSYPEPTISHYHAYDDGFAGRMSIQ